LALNTQQQAYLTTMGVTLWRDQSAPDTPSRRSPQLDRERINLLNWDELAAQVSNCEACDLHQGRSQALAGTGNQQADLLIITAAPSAEEDRHAGPLVGNAGQLLNGMLMAIGVKRHQVYLTNIVKCRPLDDREPEPQEIDCCAAYLHRQIALLQPKLIVAIGLPVAQALLTTQQSLDDLRSRVHTMHETELPLIATFAPAYLLTSPLEKRKSWQDLLLVKHTLDNLNN